MSIYETEGVSFFFEGRDLVVLYKGKRYLRIPKETVSEVLDKLPDETDVDRLANIVKSCGRKLNRTQAYLLMKVLSHPIFGCRSLIKRGNKLLLVEDSEIGVDRIRRQELRSFKDVFEDFYY